MARGLSLQLRMFGALTALVATVAVAVGATLYVIDAQKADATIINLAGRQRMLSQKYTGELLASLLGDTSAAGKAEKTRKLFDVTHVALRDGGETFMDGAMTTPVVLPATKDAQVLAQLDKVQSLWTKLTASGEELLGASLVADERAGAVAQFAAESPLVLKEMNTAVGQYQELADGKVRILGHTQLVIGAVALSIFGVTLVLVSFKVIRPLERTVETLNEHAAQLRSTAREIGEASQSVADGVSGQAAAVVETSASVEHMSESANANSDHAKKAAALGADTRSSVEAGRAAMDALTSAMESIERGTGEVSSVLSTIEDIAFQTNLLALNAAIEAEGAGEHGRRFAVVAEEVRKLAERCAKAAQETGSRIKDAVQATHNGVEHSASSSAALSEMIGAVDQMTLLVEQISSASCQQATATAEIERAVAQVDGIAQSNAAAAEETAASALELQSQGESLAEIALSLCTLVKGGPARTASASKIPMVPTGPRHESGAGRFNEECEPAEMANF